MKKTILTLSSLIVLTSCGNDSSNNDQGQTTAFTSELTSSSRVEYYTIKNTLIEKLLNNMDFSSFNTKAEYSYFSPNEESSITKTVNGNETVCNLTQDYESHIIQKNGKSILIESLTNKRQGAGLPCEKDQLKNDVWISEYKSILPSEAKSTLISAYKIVAANSIRSKELHPEKQSVIDFKINFQLDSAGFVAKDETGSIISNYHTTKPVNMDLVFKEDLEYQSELKSIDISRIRDEKISTVCTVNFPYVGIMSATVQWYLYETSEAVSCKNSSQTLSQYLNSQN